MIFAVTMSLIFLTPFLPRLFGMELWLCNDSPLLQTKTQSLLCPRPEASTLPTEQVKFQKRNTPKQKNNKPKPNSNSNTKAMTQESSKAAGMLSRNAPVIPGQDTGSMVQSLISSWMHSTDLSQLTSQSIDMAQVETNWSDKPSNNPKSKKGGIVGFFQRRFGRNRSSQALATPSQQAPQMVVHQHIHHVVHHVIHEVRQS